jgi:hypothetical protein
MMHMAISDYITCCKCGVKLIYDGDKGNRNWWQERFGKQPEIECPNCTTNFYTYSDGVMAERQRIVNLLMIQHEAAKGAHNYWHVAAQLVQAVQEQDT